MNIVVGYVLCFTYSQDCNLVISEISLSINTFRILTSSGSMP